MGGHESSKTKLLAVERALPIALCVIYLMVILYVGRLHIIGAYGTETDFYHYYAPDADRIAGGQFPSNTFNPGGYPALLVVVSQLTGDHFISGKWISIIASFLCALLAFYLFRRNLGYRAAILALPILLVSGDYAEYSIQATSDILFLALCVAAVLVFTSEKLGPRRRAAIAGAISGLAYLTRYNGVFLLITCVAAIVVLNSFNEPLAKRLKLAALNVICFLIIASPWLYLNYKHHGSPIYNTNYLNIATEFYGYKTDQDGTRYLSSIFHSFTDVMKHNPGQFVTHYFVNLYESLWISISGRFMFMPVGLLGVAGFLLAMVKRRQKGTAVFLLSIAIYFFLMAFNHWENRYYFYLLVGYAGLACYLLVEVFDWAKQRWALAQRLAQAVLLVIAGAIFFFSASRAYANVRAFLDDDATELIGACEYLRRASDNGTRRIMARKPHIAYLCQAEWVFFPDVKTVEELHSALKRSPAEYLVYDRPSLKKRPELKILGAPQNGISWLKPVYTDLARSFVLYQVQLENDTTLIRLAQQE